MICKQYIAIHEMNNLILQPVVYKLDYLYERNKRNLS